jgi:hypothetical protein
MLEAQRRNLLYADAGTTADSSVLERLGMTTTLKTISAAHLHTGRRKLWWDSLSLKRRATRMLI